MQWLRSPIAFALLLTWPATSAGSSVSVRAEVRVPPIQRLETTPGVIEIPPVTVADLERGVLEVPEPVTLMISSNVSWELFVRRADPSGPAMEGRLDHGPFRDIGLTWSSIATGPAGTDHTTRQLQVRLAVRWTTAAPGDHGLRLAYRLVPRGN